MTNIEINIKRTISDEMISDIFMIAEADGITYWAPLMSLLKEKPGLYTSATVHEDEEETGQNMTEYQIDGPKIIAAMKRIIEEKTVRSDLWQSIIDSVIDEDTSHIDGECADVIFQIACFGEVKYG